MLLPRETDRRIPRVPSLSEGLQRLFTGPFGGGPIDGAQIPRNGLAVLPADVAQAVADHVHDAQLDERLRVDRRDRLAEAGEAIDAANQDVFQSAVLKLGEHLEPELGPFAVGDPESQQFLLPVEVQSEGEVNRLAPHLPVLSHLHRERVEPDDRVEGLQRAVLPGYDLFEHRGGHVRDERGRDLGVIEFLKMPLDLTGGHATRIEGDDLVIERRQSPLVLTYDLRLKATFPVAWHLDLDLSVFPFEAL